MLLAARVRTMAKKRRTPEEVAKRVRSKGFNDDKSTVDPAPVHASLQPCTEALYDRVWGFWKQWVLVDKLLNGT